jgi:hypothetical protein
VDPTPYEVVRQALEPRGFRSLGAFEDLTLTSVYPHQRTFVAAYVDASGECTALTYSLQGKQVVEFDTTIEGGRTLVTWNAEQDFLTPPPEVEKRTLPGTSTAEQVLAVHTEAVQQLRAREPGVRLVRISTLDDVLEQARRATRIAAEHRRAVGLLTEEEMLRFVGKPAPEKVVLQVWSEFQRLVESTSHAPA